MTVSVKFSLDGVLKVDDVEQTITTNAVFKVQWMDELLKWNPDNFGGIGIKVTVRLTLTRRPTFILLNVYLPIIILSFLNAAVFAVPVDSGEKLSYVLTVLLSLAVFMSTVSGMLPTTSNHTPYITIYLSCLIVISTLSVLMTHSFKM
ncbi:acetylcholine receptor subunit alpha-like [Patella vulgata]|uniref:acetylcholine receptor subunit alpha-like n=1 Tax=Patella vulgata TaxID=6465 RepID=UPI0024A7FB63|nr:acetylcholine receptor subunit alpha-like [Patella vulgata]